jgi:hypothetical protein
MSDTCGQCLSWVKIADGKGDTLAVGQCRRFPPGLIPLGTDRAKWGFPHLAETHPTCMEFIPREGRPLTEPWYNQLALAVPPGLVKFKAESENAAREESTRIARQAPEGPPPEGRDHTDPPDGDRSLEGRDGEAGTAGEDHEPRILPFLPR